MDDKMKLKRRLKRQELEEQLAGINSHAVRICQQWLTHLNVGIPQWPLSARVSFGDQLLERIVKGGNISCKKGSFCEQDFSKESNVQASDHPKANSLR
jgi:hypothetical protein